MTLVAKAQPPNPPSTRTSNATQSSSATTQPSTATQSTSNNSTSNKTPGAEIPELKSVKAAEMATPELAKITGIGPTVPSAVEVTQASISARVAQLTSNMNNQATVSGKSTVGSGSSSVGSSGETASKTQVGQVKIDTEEEPKCKFQLIMKLLAATKMRKRNGS